MSSLSIKPGSLVGGEFEILRPLAAGGMGAVYVARQRSTSEERALKVMLPAIASNAALRARFEREAKVGANIESDHIVKVIAAGFDEELNSPWLAMELLRGQDLRALIAESGPLDARAALELMTEFGHALAAAHDKGIIHRDLKPENLFLAELKSSQRSRMVKVLDFGIAKLTADVKTQASMAMGTPLWMAPEQSAAGSPISASADLWAVGLIGFFFLTGKVFWRAAAHADAGPMAVMREVLFDPIPPASERALELGVAHLLPEGFDAWFAGLLQREAADRPPSTRDVFAAFAALVDPSHAARTAPAVSTAPAAPADRAAPATRVSVAPASFVTASLSPRPSNTVPLAPVSIAPALSSDEPPVAAPSSARRSRLFVAVAVLAVVIGGAAWGTVTLLGSSGGSELSSSASAALEAPASETVDAAAVTSMPDPVPQDQLDEGHAVADDPPRVSSSSTAVASSAAPTLGYVAPTGNVPPVVDVPPAGAASPTTAPIMDADPDAAAKDTVARLRPRLSSKTLSIGELSQLSKACGQLGLTSCQTECGKQIGEQRRKQP